MSRREHLLARYLENHVSPDARWVFVHDPQRLFPDHGTLSLHGEAYTLLRYEHPLQLRLQLESEKDDPHRTRRILISSQDQDGERLIGDYVARSTYVRCTPRLLLESLPSGHRWSLEVNQLTGADFWEHLGDLERLRAQLGTELSPDACQRLLLSLLLGRNLLAPWDAATARRLRVELIRDARLEHVRERYPRLHRYLESTLQRLLPIEEQADQDETFVHFLWTFEALLRHGQPHEIFLPRIFQETWHRFASVSPERVVETCARLERQHPEQLREQVKCTEAWLTQDPQRFRLFNRCIGVDPGDPQRTLHCLTRERHFCTPIREGLRILAQTLVASPTRLNAQELRSLTRFLMRHHTLIAHERDALQMRDFVRLFQDLVTLSERLHQAETWGRSEELTTSLTAWTDAFYPNVLASLEYLRDRIEAENLRHELLTHQAFAQLQGHVAAVLAYYHRLFESLVATHYPTWLQDERVPCVLHLWSQVIRPALERYRDLKRETGPQMLILVLENLRWDGWEQLRPLALQTLQGKLALEDQRCLAGLLPSTPGRFLEGLLGGEVGTASPYRFEHQGLRGEYWAETPPEEVLRALESSPCDLIVASVSLFRSEILATRHKLAALTDHMRQQFETRLQPILAGLPDDRVVILCSSQGMIETEGTGELWIQENAEVHRRHVWSEGKAGPSGWVSWPASQIGLSGEQRTPFFAWGHRHLAVASSGALAPGRYTNGGISPQEMLLPCALFVPRASGQLEMF